MNIAGIIQRLRRLKLAIQGLKLDRSCYVGPNVSLGSSAKPLIPGSIEVGSQCELNQGVDLNPWGGKIRLDRKVWLGPYVVIYGHGGVEIGEQSLISMHCTILSSSHTIPSEETFIRDMPDRLLPTKIGRDCWIGANAVILGGVTIGDGCVVGAGAVVTQDLPMYSVAIGVPARVIRKRSKENL
jgi:acetyltransferase-like isoleucine patch superfamily enzyme